MAKRYIYKTRLDLAVDDFCVVESPSGLAIVQVVEVHTEPEIEPNDSKIYKWVSHKIDCAAIEASKEEDRNATIEIRRHMRRKAREAAKLEIAEEFGEGFRFAIGKAEDCFDVEVEEPSTEKETDV